MHSETLPTSKQLLASWARIWQQKLNGKPDDIKQAISSHVKLFPKGNHSEVEVRTKRTIAAHSSDPKTIRALLNRAQANLRNL